MMSQKPSGGKDREGANKEYLIHPKAALEIRMLHEKLDHLITNHQEE
jgi:uncharacterized membrane protein